MVARAGLLGSGAGAVERVFGAAATGESGVGTDDDGATDFGVVDFAAGGGGDDTRGVVSGVACADFTSRDS